MSAVRRAVVETPWSKTIKMIMHNNNDIILQVYQVVRIIDKSMKFIGSDRKYKIIKRFINRS